MGGLIHPSPVAEESTSWRPILIGVVIVMVVVAAVVLGLREAPKGPKGPPPYAASLKISDLKMSAAQNFVGATVSYVDGTITNTGSKTVTHALVHALFKDDMGQVVGNETLPLHILQIGGPYPDVVDLSASPLTPGQSKSFRLTFESISAQWNHQYPELEITDVVTK
ncbi:MAG TPA: DUF2393 family protein [Terriglobales bacterium]|nr:DUF2393 family protein [Terriglobales bacterium]